jgi:prolyl-tRNA synthetase
VSPRNLKESVVEVSTRDKSLMEKVPVENAEQYVKDLVEKMKKECNLVK